MPALSRGAHCASNVSATVRPSTFLVARPPISNDADYLPNLAVLILPDVNQILGLVLRIQEPSDFRIGDNDRDQVIMRRLAKP